MNNFHKKQIYFLFGICLTFLMSCSITKKQSSLVTGKEIYAEQTYQKIVKNEERLQAMLAGYFVIYESSEEGDKPWIVNEGKDSVVVYCVPVGNLAKDGCWMYSSQLLTSLPNEPIYRMFFRLEPIDRDTIQGIYYEVPDDFDTPIDQIIKSPTDAFKNINFSTLEKSKKGEQVTYFRKTPLLFLGDAPMEKGEAKEGYGMYYHDHYEVSPQGMTFNHYYYDQSKTDYKVSITNKLIKMASIKK
jgi:hypothetical protein